LALIFRKAAPKFPSTSRARGQAAVETIREQAVTIFRAVRD
jgi:hypothetical protein